MEKFVNNYQGLNLDTGYDVITNNYINATDIRISTAKGESMGSWTNLQGMEQSFVIPSADYGVANGTKEIIGVGTIRNTIFAFVADDSNTNGWIYKVSYDEDRNIITGAATIVYWSSALNFSKLNPIEALGRYESDCIQRLYWTDYNNYLRSINIADANILTFDVDLIDIYPNVTWTQPIINSIQGGGSLFTGVYQIAYRLTTADGKQTLISPPSVIVHITSETENQNSSGYYGSKFEVATTKSITTTIDTSNYQSFYQISLVVIFHSQLNDTPQIFDLETQKITASNATFIVTGLESASLLSLNEYTFKNYIFTTCKTLAQKDNSLVIGNIKQSQVSIQDLLEDGETFDVGTLRHLSDGTPCDDFYNQEYNKDAHWEATWHTDSQFKFQADGVTLGGEGPNLSYKFHLEPLVVDSRSVASETWIDSTNTSAPDLEDSYTYENTSYSSMASPQLSGLIRGFKRGDTYRVGLIGYTLKGEATFVEVIGDIKFPDISEADGAVNDSGTAYFPLSLEDGTDTIAYSLGLEFTLDFTSCPSLLTKLASYQIVRVKRERKDQRRIASGMLRTFWKLDIGTANEYNFSGPSGSSSIVHLVTDETYNPGKFNFLKTNPHPTYLALIHGTYFAFYSPEISFNFNDFQEFTNSQNINLLITGAYDNYEDIATVNPKYGQKDDYLTGGLEELGEIQDIRRKLPNVIPVDKYTGLAPYTDEARGIEYIKRITNKEYTLFNTEVNNILSIPDRDFNDITGFFYGGGALGSNYMRNFFAQVDNGKTLNEPDLASSRLFKGASGLLGTMAFIDTDPLTGSTVSIVPSTDDFDGGTQVISTADSDRSMPIFDLQIPKAEVYGGFNQNALENNTFIPCSAIIPISDLNFKCFGGDIFLNLWVFQEGTTWNQRPYYDAAEPNVNRYSFNATQTTSIVVETMVNTELNYGSTTKSGVAYSVAGGPSGVEDERYRQETNNSNFGNLVSQMYGYNEVFSKENNDLSFFVNPRTEFKVCGINDVRVYLSNVKTNEEIIDSWTQFGALNFFDVDDYGPINKLLAWKNYIYFFQDKAFGYLSINPRALVTAQDGQNTELGSAQGITDALYIAESNGSIHQWAIKQTNNGIYIFDAINKKILLFQGENNPLSEIKGIHSFLESLPTTTLLRKENEGDNPILYKGVHIGKDTINDEVLFTFLSSGNATPLAASTAYTLGTIVSYTTGNKLYTRKITTAYTSSNVLIGALITELLSKSVAYISDITLVYDEIAQSFSSFYTAAPSIYLENGNILMSPNPGNRDTIFTHNKADWGKIYGTVEECSIQCIINPNQELNKVLRFLEFTSIVRDSDKTINRLQTITAFRLHNENQDTGKIAVSSSNLKRKFDKWRIKLPRDINSTNQRGRLRSSYFIVTLYYNNSTNKELIMNRLFSYYDVQIF